MGAYKASIELPPAETTVWSVRRLVAETLQLWGWSTSDRCKDAIMLASEIVTNAVEHAGSETSLVLELAQSGRWLRVSLADNSSVRPMVQEMDHRRRRGRGMQLVENIAQRWGVDHLPDGKRVWFEMDAKQPQ